MALLNFARGRAAPAAQPAADPAAAIAPLLAGYSIEVMPRTAAKIADFRSLLPRGTRTYIAHIDGTPFEEMLETAVRLAAEGMVPVPHLPARSIPDAATLGEWVSRYAGEAGVTQALVLGGGRAAPSGDFDNAMQLLESGVLEAHRLDRIDVAGHPEGNRDITPDDAPGPLFDALRAKQAWAAERGIAMGIATQFVFEAAPALAWAGRLPGEGVHLPVHLGIAGPAKLQTLIRFAIACGVGPSLSVLQKRARDVTKLLVPFEPTDLMTDLAARLAASPASPLAGIHLFPLGGIAAAAAWAQAHGGTHARPATRRNRQRMTRTVIESKTTTALIDFDAPFCVIGERINPTGRKKLAAELEQGDFTTVERDALEQVACGAMVLDVNSGAVFTKKMADDPRYADNNFVEPPLMRELIARIQAVVDVPLCIDSSVPAALEAGLEACEGRPLLNSVTGEEERLEAILPLVKKYNVPVVAISNDDTGISEDPDVRFAVAKRIVERAADFGIPACDIVVDPLVMPVGAMASAGRQVFALVDRLRRELGVNTTCGASNVSFGLPQRHGINAAFLPMAIGAGMTSAIMNPTRPVEMEAIRAANFLMNHDPNGSAWIAFSRIMDAMADGTSFAEASKASQEAGGGRGGRRRRRA